jgi:hypothetical protein
MLLLPAGICVVTTVAIPPTSATVCGLPPTTNVTVPVGVPLAGAAAATVAVTVTLSPTTDGSGDTLNVVVVDPWFTVAATVPVDPPKFSSPLYVAVRLLLPTSSCVLATDATPPTRGTIWGLPPRSNVTAPVGVPLAGAAAVTVAVRVTLSPATDGPGAAVRTVVVDPCPTVAEAVPLEPLKSSLPAYVAVTVDAPMDKEEVVKDACPVPSKGTVIGEPKPVNSTTPVGVPKPGGVTVTVAVTVTD